MIFLESQISSSSFLTYIGSGTSINNTGALKDSNTFGSSKTLYSKIGPYTKKIYMPEGVGDISSKTNNIITTKDYQAKNAIFPISAPYFINSSGTFKNPVRIHIGDKIYRMMQIYSYANTYKYRISLTKTDNSSYINLYEEMYERGYSNERTLDNLKAGRDVLIFNKNLSSQDAINKSYAYLPNGLVRFLSGPTDLDICKYKFSPAGEYWYTDFLSDETLECYLKDVTPISYDLVSHIPTMWPKRNEYYNNTNGNRDYNNDLYFENLIVQQVFKINNLRVVERKYTGYNDEPYEIYSENNNKITIDGVQHIFNAGDYKRTKTTGEFVLKSSLKTRQQQSMNFKYNFDKVDKTKKIYTYEYARKYPIIKEVSASEYSSITFQEYGKLLSQMTKDEKKIYAEGIKISNFERYPLLPDSLYIITSYEGLKRNQSAINSYTPDEQQIFFDYINDTLNINPSVRYYATEVPGDTYGDLNIRNYMEVHIHPEIAEYIGYSFVGFINIRRFRETNEIKTYELSQFYIPVIAMVNKLLGKKQPQIVNEHFFKVSDTFNTRDINKILSYKENYYEDDFPVADDETEAPPD